MSRDGDPDPGDPPPPRTPPSVGPTGAGPLCVIGALGLVIGWSIRPLAIRLGTAEPQVTWLAIALVFFLAAVVGGVAYQTWRNRRDGVRLPPHRAVNRLVLGKTCALVGAIVAGGYFGYALAHLGVGDQSATQLWHSALAGVGGVILMVAALLLEQACRVPPDRK